MTLSIRYQGAIIRDHHILLLKQIEHATGRSYWQIPGGGIEPDETEEQCVQREMLEETGLSVQIDSLLLDEPSTPGAIYQRWKTYRCAILAGEARPGSEPEAEYATPTALPRLAGSICGFLRPGMRNLGLIPISTPSSNAFKLCLGIQSLLCFMTTARSDDLVQGWQTYESDSDHFAQI
jgi:ADP-ribose pyrophosphatase YjhB (NUDIX family)